MKNGIKTDFDLIYEELNEIYAYPFDNAKDGSFYHFYSSLLDLVNSLENGVIYSTKNDKQDNKRQFDTNVENGYSYVCMTNSIEGKKYIANKMKRPVGLSFTKDSLVNLSKKSNYEFDPDKPFSQFGERANYEAPKKGNPVVLANTDDLGKNPVYIYAIGELTAGRYFICAGQKANALWPSRIFNDKETYEELKKWFMKNMAEPTQKHKYYWFTNGYVGNVTKTFNNQPIAVDGNLNKNYIPRKNVKDDKYEATMNFTFTGKYKDSFKEIIGYGQANVKDEDGNETLLSLQYVSPNGNGYKGPLVFGLNKTTGKFADETNYFAGNKSKKDSSTQWQLAVDQKLFTKLCDIFDEHEYRVYIPSGRDMHFKPSDIDTIVLPNTFKADDIVFNVSALINGLASNEPYPTDKEELLNRLLADGVIKKESAYISLLISKLVTLLQGDYKDVGVEINGNKPENYKGETTKTDFRVEKGDKQRKLLDNWPVLDTVTETTGPDNEITYKALVKLPNGKTEFARIGSEVILTAKDEAGKKYALFVYKVKSDSFMELPGGGMDEPPTTKEDFKALALDRLSFKCNISQTDITPLKDTDKALILHEVGVAKKKLDYDWSYYRLYTAEYKKILSSEETDYRYDNNEVANSLGKRGYNAYMRWLPIDSLRTNRAITDRYFNIIDLIENS